MIKLLARWSVVALAATAAIYGCSSDHRSPTAPTSTIGFAHALGLEVPPCGEDTYLTELSALLPAWRDSIQAWLPGVTLNETPEWTGGSVADYLGLLVPALQQWPGAVNAAAGSEVLAPVSDFDAETDATQAYLSGLSDLLADWETSAEAARGFDFLATPPTFSPDTFAPMIQCPADTSITCADPAGAVLDFEVLAVDDCDPAPIIESDPPSGSTFPVGTTTVTCTATDASGNVGTCSFDVTVEAATVTIVHASANPSMLWPPNHKMVDISFNLDIDNPCGLELTCRVLDVSSNEPINGLGDGNTEPDWRIDQDGSLELRAERSGTGHDRVYKVHLRCEDAAGIGDETTVEVVVPHNRS